MTTNHRSTLKFIFGSVALAAGIVSQVLLSLGYGILAVCLFALASIIFVFFMRDQPGPNVVVGSNPTSTGFVEPVGRHLFKKISQSVKDFNFRSTPAMIGRVFRLLLAAIKQNRFVAGLVVAVIGLAGQIMLAMGQFTPGNLLTVSALIVFGMIFQDQSGPQAKLPDLPAAPSQQGDPNRVLYGQLSLGLAIIFAILAFWMFGVTAIPAIIPWALHIGSIGLLIAAGFCLNYSSVSPGSSHGQETNRPGWNWLGLGVFIAILALAAFMRVYRLDQLPFGTWYDEAGDGLNALKILNQPGYLPAYIEDVTMPAHYIYLIAFFFKILGTSTASLRAAGVVLGTATVAAAYLAGRELFNHKMGLVLAFFLAVSRWDIIWSRIALHGVSVPFFELLSVGLILRALRKQQPLDYCLAGLSLGLGLCFYTPLFLFPLVVGIFLLVLWFRRHDLVSSSWRGLLILILGIFIASVPVSQFILREPNSFFSRMSTTSIFKGKSPQEGWSAVAQTTRQHLLMFNYQGDRNGRHNLPGEPMLDPISGALLLLGVGLSLWRIRQPGSFLLIIWLLLMLVPAIFSLDFEAPQSNRGIGSLPAAYLLAIVPIHALWQEWNKSSEKRPAVVFVLPLVLVLAGVGGYNYHVYFNLQAEDSASWSAFSTPETLISKAMVELGPQVDYYVSVFFYKTPTIQFLAPKITDYHPLQTYDSLPILSAGDKTLAFFIDLDRKPFYIQAKHFYPNADFKEYKAPNGNVILYQIILKPSDIAASQGITASYYHDPGFTEPAFLVRKETGIAAEWREGQPAAFPFWVKWQGVLFVEKYGLYHFTLKSPSPAELSVDNQPIQLAGEGLQSVDISLAKGSHEIILKSAGVDGNFELTWQPPGQEMTPIPTSNLFLPPFSNNGLLGKYFPNGTWQDPPAFTQVDPWIHFYFQNQPLPRPYTVEWTGRIKITNPGEYRFGLESIDESLLFIDDASIINETTPNQIQEGKVSLSAGFHTIRLRYADRSGYSHINLYWTPPDAEQEIIPQDVLYLP